MGAAVNSSPLRRLEQAEIEKLLTRSQDFDELVKQYPDPFLKLAANVYPEFVRSRDAMKAQLSKRDELLLKLSEHYKQSSSDEEFYPDANSTLRMTIGRVEGYKASDAVTCEP